MSDLISSNFKIKIIKTPLYILILKIIFRQNLKRNSNIIQIV